MKLNKLFLGLLAMVGLVLASCSKDEYTPAEVLTNAQVYFSNETAEQYNLEMKDEVQVVNIPLYRINKDNDLTVNISAEGADGEILSVPASVTFPAGETKVDVPVTVNTTKMGYDNPMPLVLSIADDSYTTPYGLTKMDLSIGVPAPWETIGEALYIEQFVGCFFGVDNLQYKVEIQENTLIPGFYRLVNPYDGKYGYNGDGDWDTSQNYYLEIHAENPDKVYISTQNLGFNWGYGMFVGGTLAGYYIAKGDEASASAYYGKLQDGVLTFPSESLLCGMLEYKSGSMYGCGDGTPILVLPGYSLADNSIETVFKGIFTDTQEQAFAVIEATLGADVTTAKAVVVEASADPAAVADAIAAGELEATDITNGNNNVPVGDLTGELQVVSVTLVGDAVKEIATSAFEYYGGGSNPWKSLGKGLYTEDFVYSLYSEDASYVTYEVEILESTETPGRYRLVNPYGAAFPMNEEGDYDPTATNYLEINATDPDGVYVPTQSTGLNYGQGEITIESWGYYYYKGGSSLEELKNYGYLGTLKDGVITLPTFKVEGKDMYYQGLVYLGTSGYYGGANGAFKVVLPEAVTATAKAKAKASVKKAKSVRRTLNGVKMEMAPVNKNMVKSPANEIK